MELVSVQENNYKEVATIYAQGIATGVATFETTIPNWQHWDKSHLPFGRIGANEHQVMQGWAALSPVSSRCVYGGVAEISIYIAEKARGKGIGKFLLQALISASETNNIWTLQAGVFRENKASIALHERCGFRIIGFKERIGQINGVWKDNILLERRSSVVGV
jgi:L-amino acid N-acyltransferase YncA